MKSSKGKEYGERRSLMGKWSENDVRETFCSRGRVYLFFHKTSSVHLILDFIRRLLRGNLRTRGDLRHVLGVSASFLSAALRDRWYILIRRGNESFVSEDYGRALELYTDALAQGPVIPGYKLSCTYRVYGFVRFFRIYRKDVYFLNQKIAKITGT